MEQENRPGSGYDRRNRGVGVSAGEKHIGGEKAHQRGKSISAGEECAGGMRVRKTAVTYGEEPHILMIR